MADLRLNSPLQYVKGVGPGKAEVLAQHDLHTVRDILFYYPRSYLDRSSVIPIENIRVDQTVTIIGQVKAHGVLRGRRRRYEVILQDDSGALTLLWFGGIKYWDKLFKKGQVFAATGTVTYYMGYQMIHPDLERLEEDSDHLIHSGRIIPVYPQTSELNRVGLNSKGIRRTTSFIFDNLTEKLPDPLPNTERRKLGLVSLFEAISRIHYPEDRDQIETCRRRLAYDELLGFLTLVFRNREKKVIAVKNHTYDTPGQKLSTFKTMLPFELTSGQKRAIKEIFSGLQSKYPMMRLLQGDVGCGKTVVAVLAALYVTENNKQVAFMAPTEILAEQHFRNWEPILSKLGVGIALLTSSLKPSKKKETAALCANGDIQILFGTHALIYDYVVFRDLGLVIIDEQHRFGVEQRNKLHAKGDNPDLLVITATPIPRTLALTLYGDLDISTIDTLPPGRKAIRTMWRSHDAHDKVYQFVKDEIKAGGQAYIIYPLIERTDQTNLESVEDSIEMLKKGPFSDLRVGMVHGRIKPKDRDEILGMFRNRDLDILLATTVIEVGIDNPNATVMIIQHAERFGLAQLHQLRGRIGRGEKQATMVALAHPPLSEIARKRLQFLTSTTDGFEIAEADLELRGPGEMFGVRQSGLPELRVARLSVDRDLIDAAHRLLNRLFGRDKNLDTEDRKLYNYLVTMATSSGKNFGGG
ncbi:MAG: ATP-dependent DNA helicase RecG [candidate division Zixibacteria bacterium]|nr:ATP-dependent DNA helicase RecG [candidate division Zixibacteria bacterium]